MSSKVKLILPNIEVECIPYVHKNIFEVQAIYLESTNNKHIFKTDGSTIEIPIDSMELTDEIKSHPITIRYEE